MSERVDVAVIGGGQAGLSVSHELTAAGLEHVVLERDRVGASWAGRWDSFCLVTPNWSIDLPGGRYMGDDTDGFLPRDEIVAHLEGYASSFRAPVRTGIEVTSLTPITDGLALETSNGRIRARAVVVATGAYQRPYRPPGAETLPPSVMQLDAVGYRRPDALPDGAVLVVGSGQTGCQIAEELHLSGREVFLACGRAPWITRRIGEHDVVWWAKRTGFLDQPVDALPDPSARFFANLQASGARGGHDLHFRTLQAAGVTLLGRFLGADDGHVVLGSDLAASVAWGDARRGEFMDLVVRSAPALGEPLPPVPDPEPFDATAPERIELGRLGAVVFAGGYRPAYRDWVGVPSAFDEQGFPLHRNGVSTVVPGLFFVGVHFLRTRQSSLLSGVGADAAVVAQGIADLLRARSGGVGGGI